MPPRRRSSEPGQVPSMEPPGTIPNSSPAAADKRRSIPLPNLETASRLKTYVGNAINTASAAPAWLASKAVPVAADGAGMLRNAAADRVALFRRGTQYDELEEEEDEAMKGRTMALSSDDAPPQLPAKAAGAAHQGREAGGDAASEPSPTGRSANGCSSARSSAHNDEPAMILFDEDDDPPAPAQQSSRGRYAGNETCARPSSAASSVSAASDLLSEGWPSSNGGFVPVNARVAAPAQSPAAKPGPAQRPLAAAAAQPSPENIGRRSPYAPLRPSSDSVKALRTPQLSFVSDDSAMEVPVGRRNGGGGSGSPLVHLQAEELSHRSASAEQPASRNSSLQPLIGKGTPPPAPRPSRPPPPPPIDPDLLSAHADGRNCAPMVSRQSSASSSIPERGTLRRTEDSELGSSGPGGSWDIFEPRAAADTAAAGPLSEGANGAGMELAALKHMTGRQLLQTLEVGAPMRKKWVTRLSAEEAAAAAKTTRHVRCFVRGGKVCLRYLHQGVKGLLDRVEVSAMVQRVEVPGGNWAPGASITVYTSRGTLLLEPLGPGAYSQWVLGLNAALVACQTRRKEYVYACPAHTIPRNSMFVVAEPTAAAAAPAPR